MILYLHYKNDPESIEYMIGELFIDLKHDGPHDIRIMDRKSKKKLAKTN